MCISSWLQTLMLLASKYISCVSASPGLTDQKVMWQLLTQAHAVLKSQRAFSVLDLSVLLMMRHCLCHQHVMVVSAQTVLSCWQL